MCYTCHDIPAYHVIDKQVYHMITIHASVNHMVIIITLHYLNDEILLFIPCLYPS